MTIDFAYVRSAWYVAGWSHDLAAAEPAACRILGEPIVMFRDADGTAHALEDRCPHRFAPLSAGRCEAGGIRCMYHGILFGADGRAIEIPGQEMIPPGMRARAYPIVDRHGWLWIWMGEARDADPATIPPAIGIDDPRYCMGHGAIDYAAEAQLVSENLLDLNHTPFLHANSFGISVGRALVAPRVTAIASGVRVERWTRSDSGNTLRTAEPADRYLTYDFHLPGVFVLTTADFPLGTGERMGEARPDPADAISGVTTTSQSVTPIGPRQARYHFAWGPDRRFGGETLRDALLAMAHKAFQEDKAMIEAQQQVIDIDPTRNFSLIKGDTANTLYRNLVRRLCRKEAAIDGAEAAAA